MCKVQLISLSSSQKRPLAVMVVYYLILYFRCASVQCILKLVECWLVLLLVTRLPRAQRRDLRSRGQAGFYYIPLVTGQVDALEDWSGIIYMIIAASTRFVGGRCAAHVHVGGA